MSVPFEWWFGPEPRLVAIEGAGCAHDRVARDEARVRIVMRRRWWWSCCLDCGERGWVMGVPPTSGARHTHRANADGIHVRVEDPEDRGRTH